MVLKEKEFAGITYLVTNSGTYYHKDTPHGVIQALEHAREIGRRIRVDLGDPDTGKSWMEENDVEGYVGRSCGMVKVPLLLFNRRSTGGGSLLTDHILRIRLTSHKSSRESRVLYQAENYVQPELRLKRLSEDLDYPWEVERMVDAGNGNVRGEIQARFKSQKAAERYIARFTL